MLVPDLLTCDLQLVFCGTAPSRASYQAKAYYARPGNRFWPTLAAVGITPRRFAPQEYPLLLDLGIGLTDLCKNHFGVDSELPPGCLDALALSDKIRLHRPRRLAFTSKNAAQAALGLKTLTYGLQPHEFEGARVWVLPSPSGLATRFWDQRPWLDLAMDLRSDRIHPDLTKRLPIPVNREA